MLTLTYNSGSYEFPGVQFENTDTLDTGVITNVSRGKSVGVARKGYAPEIRRYSVKALPLAKANDMATIMTTLAAQVATVTDDLGRSYSAVVLTEQMEIVTVKDLCSYDFTIDLVVVSNYVHPFDVFLTTEASDGLITEDGLNEIIV